MINKISLAFSSIWYSFLLFLPDEFSKYRVRYYNKKNCKIDKTCSISSNVRIKGRVEMGERSSIAQNCSITGENVGVFIGKDVMIAPNVVIVAFNHESTQIDVPMIDQGNIENPIFIENNCWIAANCTIAMGVRIGEGSIIGANSFVNKDIPPFSIAGGLPAKVIKYRKENLNV